MKTIRVAAAVIQSVNENGEPVILESPAEALVREIREELDTTIVVGELIDTIEYDYPDFHLSMDCFLCEIEDGSPVLKEHEAARWLTKEQLNSVDWLPADLKLIGKCADIL